MACASRQHFPRRPLPAVPRPMRGREKIRRGRFARKEQPPIDRRGQHGALAGMAGQRVRIGAAREGVVGPARFRERLQLAAEVVAEERRRSRRCCARRCAPSPASSSCLRKACRRKSLRCRAGRTGADDRCPSRCAWWRRADCLPSAALPARPAPASPCRRGRAAGRARRRPLPAAAG